MKRTVVLLILMVCFWTSTAGADSLICTAYDDPQTREAVQLVHDAVELVRVKGEAAFDDFSVKGSRWFKDDKYVFIHALDGELVCNPAFPGMVGKQMIDFKDVSGKPPVRFMIDQVTKDESSQGWVHYLWPMPGNVEPSWKSSFVHGVTAPSGRKYMVATGVHGVSMERCFAEQQVEDAARLVARQGAKSFEYLRSRSGPFVWKESYVYVIGMDGIEYVNPAQPELEGTDVSRVKDANGEFILEKMRNALTEKNGVWIKYKWPKPGLVMAYEKKAYIKLVRHGGMQYMVGCGVYLD